MIITSTSTGTQSINPFTEEMQHRIFNETLEELHTERAENWQLRELVAQLEEERDQLRTTRCPHCTKLEKENELLHEQLNFSEKQRVQQFTHYSHIMEWIQKLFHNTTIPAACKLVLFYFFLTHGSYTDREMKIGVEEAAKAIGMSTSTIRKATDKFQSYDLLKRRYEPVTTENGDKRTLVHITLNNAINKPDKIEMENNHGGQRAKTCHKPDCRSNNIDRYTLQYCRDCAGTEWYKQPGLRADANEENAQQAIANEWIQRHPHNYPQKQDAFHSHDQGDAVVQPASPPVSDFISQAEYFSDRVHQANQDEEYTRYVAAEKIIADLRTYGLALDYQEDGRHIRKTIIGTTTPTPAQIRDLIAQVKRYDAEVHSLLNEEASYDPHIAAQLYNATLTTEKQDALPQLATQPISTISKASCSEVTTCRAGIWLNKNGEPARGLDKVYRTVECGSTHWYYSSEEKVHRCQKCDTAKPMPISI